MTTSTYICNVALSHIGIHGTIASLTEQSNEAKACNLHYEQAKKYVLRDHDWNFARKRLTLALTGTAPSDWLYQYQYPSDCLRALEIIPEIRAESNPIPFEVALKADLNERVILTDQENAVMRYTVDIDAAFFDSLFTQALAWYIAVLIAQPLTGKKAIRDDALAGYNLSLQKARATDSNEREEDRAREADHITARL